MDLNEFSERMAAVTGQSGGVAAITLNDGTVIRGFVKGVQFYNLQSCVQVADFVARLDRTVVLADIASMEPG